MMRKALMVAATVALTSAGKHIQILSSLGIMIGFLVCHVYACPYANRTLNMLETSGLVTSVATLYGGLYLFTVTSYVGTQVVTWLVTAVNLIWLLLFTIFFFKNILMKLLAKFGIEVSD